ncbi:hypothetical protein glysoja_019922 [Glycine soja]|nr:hypothetical protein glysoja_019922 [Glycine soja]
MHGDKAGVVNALEDDVEGHVDLSILTTKLFWCDIDVAIGHHDDADDLVALKDIDKVVVVYDNDVDNVLFLGTEKTWNGSIVKRVKGTSCVRGVFLPLCFPLHSRILLTHLIEDQIQVHLIVEIISCLLILADEEVGGD